MRVVLNRIDPALFEACFMDWPKPCGPTCPTSLRWMAKRCARVVTRAMALGPIHLASAWASTQRPVLAQEAVEAKTNGCAAILAILDRLSITGALVTIDTIATNPTIATAIINKGGGYILALKRNQPTRP